MYGQRLKIARQLPPMKRQVLRKTRQTEREPFLLQNQSHLIKSATCGLTERNCAVVLLQKLPELMFRLIGQLPYITTIQRQPLMAESSLPEQYKSLAMRNTSLRVLPEKDQVKIQSVFGREQPSRIVPLHLSECSRTARFT